MAKLYRFRYGDTNNPRIWEFMAECWGSLEKATTNYAHYYPDIVGIEYLPYIDGGGIPRYLVFFLLDDLFVRTAWRLETGWPRFDDEPEWEMEIDSDSVSI